MNKRNHSGAYNGPSEYRKILGIIFTAVGTCLLIAILIVAVSSARFFKNAVRVDATINDIEAYRGSDGDTNHKVYVSYNYSGKYYDRVLLGSYSSSMYIGETINAYVDPKKPEDIRQKGNTIQIVLIISGMGMLFAVGGSIVLASEIKKRNALKVKKRN